MRSNPKSAAKSVVVEICFNSRLKVVKLDKSVIKCGRLLVLRDRRRVRQSRELCVVSVMCLVDYNRADDL